jgi:hypothetical protein
MVKLPLRELISVQQFNHLGNGDAKPGPSGFAGPCAAEPNRRSLRAGDQCPEPAGKASRAYPESGFARRSIQLAVQSANARRRFPFAR